MPVHPFEPPRGRIETLTIDSAALRGNLLGDPAARRVAVYLPEGYDASDADYPLFVDLVGFTGSGMKHLGWQAFAENVPQRLDRLVAAGAMGLLESARDERAMATNIAIAAGILAIALLTLCVARLGERPEFQGRGPSRPRSSGRSGRSI